MSYRTFISEDFDEFLIRTHLILFQAFSWLTRFILSASKWEQKNPLAHG